MIGLSKRPDRPLNGFLSVMARIGILMVGIVALGAAAGAMFGMIFLIDRYKEWIAPIFLGTFCLILFIFIANWVGNGIVSMIRSKT